MEKIDGNNVTIKITRDSSCGENCAMCNACPSKNMSITMITDIPLSVNDKVLMETNSKHILLWAFMVYILPIILLIAGYAIFTLYVGLILMVTSFVFLFIFDKKINKNKLLKLSKMH